MDSGFVSVIPHKQNMYLQIMNNRSSHTYMLLQRMSQDIHTNVQLLFFCHTAAVNKLILTHHYLLPVLYNVARFLQKKRRNEILSRW